jgi:hypothetical protein
MEKFKDFLGSKRTRVVTPVIIESVDETIDNIKLDIVEKSETEVSTPIKERPSLLTGASKILGESELPSFSSQPTTGFIGSFNYIPEPNMFAEGAEYRNKNNGTVYKKVGNLWEEYIRDGRDGRSFAPVGGGCGVQEVNQIFNSKIIVSSAAPEGTAIPGTIWIVV